PAITLSSPHYHQCSCYTPHSCAICNRSNGILAGRTCGRIRDTSECGCPVAYPESSGDPEFGALREQRRRVVGWKGSPDCHRDLHVSCACFDFVWDCCDILESMRAHALSCVRPFHPPSPGRTWARPWPVAPSLAKAGANSGMYNVAPVTRSSVGP